MNALSFWVGSLLLASVRRTQRCGLLPTAHRRFIERQGGYRSLQFLINSTHYHWRKEEQRKAMGFVPTFRGAVVEERP